MTKKLIMFYGRECPHCKVMLPLADRLSKEKKIKIEKIEVWHNEKNADKMRSFKDIIVPACDGGGLCVPAFIEEKLKKAFCGEDTYEHLKNWAKNLKWTSIKKQKKQKLER